MRRLQLGVLAAVVPALLVSLALVGCGGKDKDEGGGASSSNPKGGEGSGSARSKGPTKAVEAGTGTLKGKVTLEGKPDLTKLTEDLRAEFNKKPEDKDYCLKAPEDQKSEQEWKVGANNGLGNVFVWIEPLTRDEYFKIDDKQLKDVPKEVTMDQPFCAFVPHCVVLFPKYRDPKSPKSLKETGQKFVAKNDAEISHNTKMDGGSDNPTQNETLPKKTNFKALVFNPSKQPINISCGIHPWMRAYARAFDHPYATLTKVCADPKDPNYGTYEIKNVPAAKVKVIAWHEKADFLGGKGAQGEEIDLKAGENTKDFTAKYK